MLTFNDGGRAACGYKGHAGDCVARALAIASGKPYAEIYERLARETGSQRMPKGAKRSASARNGVHTHRKWFKDYMRELGFTWTPTMAIGSGCKVHVDANELPKGTLVLALSKHLTAMIDGVIHDTHDPRRSGTRCVYGYWTKIPTEGEADVDV